MIRVSLEDLLADLDVLYLHSALVFLQIFSLNPLYTPLKCCLLYLNCIYAQILFLVGNLQMIKESGATQRCHTKNAAL